MRKLEHPTDEGEVTEDNRPVTGTYLDHLPVGEVDWGLYWATKEKEEILGRPMSLIEDLAFTFRNGPGLSLNGPEVTQKVHETIEMLADLACGIDRG